MSDLYGRSVFFVADAERARGHYVDVLGFALDWDSHDGVLQVSLLGLELILNQAWGDTLRRVGHGRVFVGLEDDQGEPLRQHVKEHGVRTSRVEWGRPTLVMKDLDLNEIYFWMPADDFADMGIADA